VIRPVLRYPHPALKQVARALAPDEEEEIARVAADLVDTMDSFGHCVGLAATQLGEMVRMIVVDVTGHKKATPASNGRLVLVNPRIVSASGAEVGREGCLSIPELTANVRRATTIDVDSTDGVIRSQGFEARCLQHELDHLDGLLFLDRVDSLTADVFRRKRRG
jgi:peptide deformylase